MGSYSDGAEYWVSCGIAYSSDSHIWISQFSYKLKGLNPDYNGINEYSLQNVTEIEDGGKVLTTNLTLKIRKPRTPVKIEALVLTETTDVVPIKIEMVSAAKAFGYSFRAEKFLAQQYDNCLFRDTTHQLLALDLGTIVNKESQKSPDVPSDHEIVLRISWMVTNTGVVGNLYTMGVGVDLETGDISITGFNLTVISRDPVAPPLTEVSASTLGPNTVNAGGVGIALINIQTPVQSFHTYVMTLNTVESSGTESMLSILSYSIHSRGDNIPCNFDDGVHLFTSNTDPKNPTVTNIANMTFSVLNTGMMSSNNLEMKIMVRPLPTAVKYTVYELNIDINGIKKAVAFKVIEFKVYDKDAAYVFTSTLPQGGRIFTGAQFTLEMTVATERNKMPGPMTIELPIPYSTAYVKILKARTKSRGANVICPTDGDLTMRRITLSNAVSDNASAVISIPLVCNVQSKDDVIEDNWVIEFDLQMVDDIDLFESEIIIKFGVSVRFYSKEVFLGKEEIISIPPERLTEVKMVKSIVITDSVPLPTWPGDYQLQWSPDLKTFFSTKIEWLAEAHKNWFVLTLKRPMVAKYIRLTTPSATGSPALNYTVQSQLKSSYLKFLGDTAASDNLSKLFMFVLDNDIESCMNLPLKNDTDVPPYMIGLINTRILVDNAYADGTFLVKSFKITLTGEGISCNTSGGPQRTMVWHPKESMTEPFHGKLSRCPLVAERGNYNGTSKTQCQYDCACDSADTCKYVLLVMIHDNIPEGSYNLCDLRLTENP